MCFASIDVNQPTENGATALYRAADNYYYNVREKRIGMDIPFTFLLSVSAECFLVVTFCCRDDVSLSVLYFLFFARALASTCSRLEHGEKKKIKNRKRQNRHDNKM